MINRINFNNREMYLAKEDATIDLFVYTYRYDEYSEEPVASIEVKKDQMVFFRWEDEIANVYGFWWEQEEINVYIKQSDRKKYFELLDSSPPEKFWEERDTKFTPQIFEI